MLTSSHAPLAAVRLFSVWAFVALVIPRPAAAELSLVQLWRIGTPAFGIYAPNENAGPRGQAPRPAVYSARAARSSR